MKKFLFLAGINGAIAVVAGALASHSPNLSSGPAATIRLGGTYHLVHAVALGLAALAARGAGPAARRGGRLAVPGGHDPVQRRPLSAGPDRCAYLCLSG